MTDSAIERPSAARLPASSPPTQAAVDYPQAVDRALLVVLGTIQAAWLIALAVVLYWLA